jgi:hypothetical protein
MKVRQTVAKVENEEIILEELLRLNWDPYLVLPNSEVSGVEITTPYGFLPDIKMVNAMIKYLKYLKRKGQRYIDEYNQQLSNKQKQQLIGDMFRVGENKRKTTSGYIYFLKCQEYVKIGISKNPIERVEQVSLLLPFEITLLHVVRSKDIYTTEKEFHNYFSNKRVNGEWFKLSDEDVNVIREIKEV